MSRWDVIITDKVGFVENYYVKQDFGSGGGGNRSPLNKLIVKKNIGGHSSTM